MDTIKPPRFKNKASNSEVICTAVGARLKTHFPVTSKDDTETFMARIAARRGREKKAE